MISGVISEKRATRKKKDLQIALRATRLTQYTHLRDGNYRRKFWRGSYLARCDFDLLTHGNFRRNFRVTILAIYVISNGALLAHFLGGI